MKKSLSIIVAAIVLLCGSLNAQDVPRIISYQGVLVGSDGKPMNGIKNLTITIVDNSGTPHSSGFTHTESFFLQGGLFFARLGAPPHSSVQFPILDGQWNLKISDGNPSNDRLVPLYSTVSALNIPDNVVTSRKIKDGEVDLQDLAPGRTTGEILKWDGTEWVRGQDEGLRSVTVEQPIEGDGTSTDPLRVTIPSGVPIGTIVAYYGEIKNTSDIPDGWLLCDGSTIPTGADYDKLRQICQNNGHSGLTPDLRGQFLRGAGITFQNIRDTPDPDFISRISGSPTFKIGSRQDDALMIHKHRTNAPTPGNNGGSSTFGSHPSNPRVIQGISEFSQSHAALTDDASAMSNKTSSETRPKNVYVNYIIKAK